MEKIPDDINPDSAEWEAICQRCGRCCYEKINHRGRIYHINQPCKQLDISTKLCRVYGQRDTRQTDCVRLTPEVIAAGILPLDCPYVVVFDECQLTNIADE